VADTLESFDGAVWEPDREIRGAGRPITELAAGRYGRKRYASRLFISGTTAARMETFVESSSDENEQHPTRI
jgi:hypothetical protein